MTTALAPRTKVEYDRDWALFTDWCAAADLQPLPADPAAVVEFLGECPAAPATLLRRVAAIDSRHTTAGLEAPGRNAVVRAALGRPPLESAPRLTTEQLHAALQLLPSRGWTVGLFGRRDRALLVLTAAGATSTQLAAATAGDMTVGNGTATLRTDSGVVMLERHDDDPTVCGPCAVGRWLRLLRLIAVSHSHRRWIDSLNDSKEITSASPHQCRKPVVLDEAQAAAPLIPRIDQWGYLETRLEPIGTRSLLTLSRSLAAGQRGRHRLILPEVEEGPAPQPLPVPPRPAEGSGVYRKDRWREAMERRRLQNQQAADLDRLLMTLEQRTKDAAAQIRQVLV